MGKKLKQVSNSAVNTTPLIGMTVFTVKTLLLVPVIAEKSTFEKNYF
jgi:hypothetical protein